MSAKLCPHSIHSFKPLPLVAQNVTISEDKAFKEVSLNGAIRVGSSLIWPVSLSGDEIWTHTFIEREPREKIARGELSAN